jgi:hypothetical protein
MKCFLVLFTPNFALGIFVLRIVDSRDGVLVCLLGFWVWYDVNVLGFGLRLLCRVLVDEMSLVLCTQFQLGTKNLAS